MGRDEKIKDINCFIEEINRMQELTKRTYIYGAGLYARNIYKILVSHKIVISGFIITSKEEQGELYGYPILNTEQVLCEDINIIVAVNSHNKVEVMQYLAAHGFDMNRVVYGTDFIEKEGVRFDEFPVMEITTKIGCSINCKYCPQNLLLERYFLDNPNRSTLMSIRTFETCLEKLPHDVKIVFGGMSEPFLNPQCTEMVRMAFEQGRKVDLYTTLIGVNSDLLRKIANIPFGYVTLHVADKLGYANIPVDEGYYELVKYVVNLKKEDGTSFVSMCNAQAEPDERVAEICQGKYEIHTELLDRAGNLKDGILYSNKHEEGVISCSFCGHNLNRNILLPDGTVLLCCMDYGMKHVLGNLIVQPYDEIMSGEEMQRIKYGMKYDSTESILCRTCTSAHLI